MDKAAIWKISKPFGSRPPVKKCRCEDPKWHPQCSYCGTLRAENPDDICGICKENGIDGHVIKGTSRVTCKIHKKK